MGPEFGVFRTKEVDIRDVSRTSPLWKVLEELGTLLDPFIKRKSDEVPLSFYGTRLMVTESL